MICQKALAPTYDGRRGARRCAEAAGAPLVVHENFRWQPWYREAKRLLDAGTLGTPHSIAFRLRPGRRPGAARVSRPPAVLPAHAALPGLRNGDPLDRHVPLPDGRGARGHRAPAPRQSGHRRRGCRATSSSSSTGGATGLFDGNRANDHVAANPRRTMGEMWLEGSAGVLRLDGDARLWWKPHHGDERAHEYDARRRCAVRRRLRARRCSATSSRISRTARRSRTRGREYLVNLRVQEAAYRSHETGPAHRACRRSDAARRGSTLNPRRPDRSKTTKEENHESTSRSYSRGHGARRRPRVCDWSLPALRRRCSSSATPTSRAACARRRPSCSAQKVEQYTQGRYKVQVFPAGQLANDPKGVEQLQLGGIDFTVTGTGTYATHIPTLNLMLMPYLVESTSRAGSSTTTRSG